MTPNRGTPTMDFPLIDRMPQEACYARLVETFTPTGGSAQDAAATASASIAATANRSSTTAVATVCSTLQMVKGY